MCLDAAEAQRMEKISLQYIQDLLRRVEEVLGLWKVLFDHQFHVIAAALSKVSKGQCFVLELVVKFSSLRCVLSANSKAPYYSMLNVFIGLKYQHFLLFMINTKD